MHIMYRKPTELPPAAQMLGKGVVATLLGTALLGAAAMLAGSTHPLLSAAAGGMRMLAPYALACGAAGLMTWMVMRPPHAASQAAWPGAAGRTAWQGGEPRMPLHWNTALFEQLTPQGFAAVCAELFSQPGRRTRVERVDAHSTDLWLHPVEAPHPVALVQCRQWTDRLVGVKELRELQGAMASRDVTRGTFVTTSAFAADAKVFARAHGIAMADVHDLLALVEHRTPAQQRELLAFAWAAR